ncbi:MAG: Crp/Fnr family transcriptional regulator [Alphaproteobacteria bacterium]|nr:Crp/Fnr family transcriptional regulator [Alphaproteobacteria bacterium]
MGQVGLEKIRLLEGLSPQKLQNLETQCRWHQFSAIGHFVEQSDEQSDVFFVVEGQVRLVSYTLAGREIIFSNVPAGEYFGELSAIDGGGRATGAVAVESCRLASVTPEVFRKLMADHPDITQKVLVRLAGTIRSSDDRIIDLCTLPAPQRVYAELMRMSEEDAVAPGTWVVRPMRTHAEIANRANTTRETVTRSLSHLVANGIVERMSKSLYIRDREQLAQLAGSGVDGGDKVNS